MDKIIYPKQSSVKHVGLKKQKEIENNTALFEIKQQIDQLETNALQQNQKTETLQNAQSGFSETLTEVANHAQRLTTAENQISLNSNSISALQSSKQNTLTFDNTPTQNSNNPVKSGGIYTALAGKQDTLSIDHYPQQNSYHPVSSDGVYEKLQEKQNTLTAGNNITIQNNVISATGGLSEVTASNVNSQTATNGQVLTANGSGGASWQTASGGGGSCNCASDILSLQSDIAQINAKLLILQSKVADNEIQYNETIYNEYDVYDRELDLVGIWGISSPIVLFATQDVLTSNDENNEIVTHQVPLNAKITVRIKTDTAGDYNILTYESYNVISTKAISISANEINIEKTITYDIKYFISGNAHSFYVKFCSNSQATESANVNLYRLKIEIVSPNVTILNKIHPFDVQFCYYTNKYYLSDCSNGFAKLAEIDANNLSSTADIVWTQTNIPAQNYKTYFIGATDNTSTTIGKKYAIITNKNDTVSILDVDQNQIIYTTNYGCYKMSQIFTKHNYSFLFKNSATTNSNEALYFSLNQQGTITSTRNLSYLDTVANIEGIRNNLNYLADSASWGGSLDVKKTGQLCYYVTYSLNTNINEYFVEDAKVYMKQVTNNSKFDYNCFIKQFGKYYHFTANYQSAFVIKSSKTLIGEYDDLFYGANNDLFVVTNNTLSYISSM